MHLPAQNPFAWVEKALGASRPELISLRPWVWPGRSTRRCSRPGVDRCTSRTPTTSSRRPGGCSRPAGSRRSGGRPSSSRRRRAAPTVWLEARGETRHTGGRRHRAHLPAHPAGGPAGLPPVHAVPQGRTAGLSGRARLPLARTGLSPARPGPPPGRAPAPPRPAPGPSAAGPCPLSRRRWMRPPARADFAGRPDQVERRVGPRPDRARARGGTSRRSRRASGRCARRPTLVSPAALPVCMTVIVGSKTVVQPR